MPEIVANAIVEEVECAAKASTAAGEMTKIARAIRCRSVSMVRESQHSTFSTMTAS